jgi:hypothetical protein
MRGWLLAVCMLCVGLLGMAILYMYITAMDDCTPLETHKTDNGIIEVVSDTCKEGMPHTTDENTIRMPLSVWNGSNRESILIHERVHLSQKRNPELWAEFYRRHWDYEIFSSVPGGVPSVYVENRRPNPDTNAAPWAIWRRRYLFFPTYEHAGVPRLKNAQVQVWDMDEKRLVPIPEAWYAQFCVNRELPHQYEHPHELSAEFLTLGSACSAAGDLRSWWMGT